MRRKRCPDCWARAAIGHAATPPSSVMKLRRFLPASPVRPTERIAHIGPAGGAALRDFDQAYDRSGSKAALAPCRLQCPVCPKADMAERRAEFHSVPQPHAQAAQAPTGSFGSVLIIGEEIGTRSFAAALAIIASNMAAIERRKSLHPAGDSEPTGGALGIGLQKHLLPAHLGQLQYHFDRSHSWRLRARPPDNNRRELFVAGHDACDVALGVRFKADRVRANRYRGVGLALC